MFEYWTWFIATGIVGSLCIIAILTSMLLVLIKKGNRETCFAVAGLTFFLLFFCVLGFGACGSMLFP